MSIFSHYFSFKTLDIVLWSHPAWKFLQNFNHWSSEFGSILRIEFNEIHLRAIGGKKESKYLNKLISPILISKKKINK